ncbi:hypothetical protein PGQ11_008183 [Apiospora arundinis]|uniref:Uncharacterized protein n=1 Tax=Apiospora arundinis TaxID=335852 RepID=A0ABR2IEA5_9PEZI
MKVPTYATTNAPDIKLPVEGSLDFSQISNQVLTRFVPIFPSEFYGPVSPVLGGTLQGPSPEKSRRLVEVGAVLKKYARDVAVSTDGGQLQGRPASSVGRCSVHVGIMGEQLLDNLQTAKFGCFL